MQAQGECHLIYCSKILRSDHRSVIWKRKATDIQNKSSSEHTKPIDIKVVNENKIIIDGVKYQSIESLNGCAECAFHGEICRKYGNKIPCLMIERKDESSVIWEKVPDKQIHVSLSEIRQTKTYKLNFKP